MINAAGGLFGHGWFVRHPKSHCLEILKDIEKNERFVREGPYEVFSLMISQPWGARKVAQRSL